MNCDGSTNSDRTGRLVRERNVQNWGSQGRYDGESAGFRSHRRRFSWFVRRSHSGLCEQIGHRMNTDFRRSITGRRVATRRVPVRRATKRIR